MLSTALPSGRPKLRRQADPYNGCPWRRHDVPIWRRNDARLSLDCVVALGAVGLLALLALFVPVTRIFNLLTAGVLP